MIGDRRDSATYVRMKKRACAEVGVNSIGIDLPIDVTLEKMMETVDNLNKDPSVHGILVQLPLPPHLDEQAILNSILPCKVS